MKKLTSALLAMAAALVLTPGAWADSTLLLTSTSTSVSSTSVSLSNLGTLLTTYSDVVTPTSGSNLFTADYSVSVYEGGADAACPTCLNFVYTLENTATNSKDVITSISTADFGDFTVAEGNLTPNTSPEGQYSSDLDGIINLEFESEPVAGGDSLDSFVLITNATQYGLGAITFQDGAVVSGESLVATTPEPSSLLLLGSGLFGLALVIFWRGKAPRLVLHS